MSSVQDLMHSEAAGKLLQNRSALEELRDAPETQTVMELLRRSTGGNLEQAAQQAANGDPSSLADSIRQVMKSPAGEKLLSRMKKALE